MQAFLLAIDLLLGFFLVALGILVLIRNSQLVLNQVFFGFTLLSALWIVCNFFSNSELLTHEHALIANHFVLFFPALAMVFMLLFVGKLTGSGSYRRWGRWVVVGSSLLACLALTPLVIESVHWADGVYAISFGSLAPLYFLAVLVPIVFATHILLGAIRKTRGEERLRYKTIFWSLIVAIAINLVTNAGLPFLGGSFALTNIGPLSMMVIVYGFFYSIARYQLFDIRSFVARSLAYVLSVGALALVYGVVAFMLIGQLIYGDLTLSFRQQLIFAILAAIITFIFQPLLRLFNVITRSIFYKDGYDPQAFLSNFNRLVVTSTGLAGLLETTSSAISTGMKVDHVFFIIRDPVSHELRHLGYEPERTKHTEFDTLVKELTQLEGQVVVADFLEASTLKRLLASKGIALISGLYTSDSKTFLGFMALGEKKSGNPYTSQDAQLIEILANELSIAIRNNLQFEEIQRFNETLQQKIDEATKELKRTNAKLKSMDETKDDFISMASHQLRTPLTSVKGYLSMVLEGDAGTINDTQRKMLSQAFTSSQRMVYLIADLLNVSRLRTGKFVVESSSVNLADIVEQEMTQLLEAAEARQLKLIYHKPIDFPMLMLDETKIRQVIMNFVDNAIYYTKSGGTIEIKLTEKSKSIEFEVVDNGIGVPRADQHRLFTKFYRAPNAQRARPDGTGLGLFMAKKVIVAQGGAIIFRSKEGKGSTFGFSFAKKHHETA